LESGWIGGLLALGGVIFFFLPKKLELPSDVFIFFYLAFCLIWGVEYWSVGGRAEFFSAASCFLLASFPF